MKIAYTKDTSPNALFAMWVRDSPWHAGVAICSDMLRSSLGSVLGQLTRFYEKVHCRIYLSYTSHTERALRWGTLNSGKSYVHAALGFAFRISGIEPSSCLVNNQLTSSLGLQCNESEAHDRLHSPLDSWKQPGTHCVKRSFNFSREILPLRPIPIPLSCDSSSYFISLFLIILSRERV